MPQWSCAAAGSARRVAICAPRGVVGPVGYVGWATGAGVCAAAVSAARTNARESLEVAGMDAVYIAGWVLGFWGWVSFWCSPLMRKVHA